MSSNRGCPFSSPACSEQRASGIARSEASSRSPRDGLFRQRSTRRLRSAAARAAVNSASGAATTAVRFVHADEKHLPKLHVGGGEFRRRYLFVAIDRRSRFVHRAVRDDNTERSALAFLDEVVTALPFRIRYLRTDRGSCFTADAFEARCLMLGIEHRRTRLYSPQTNGMVERFNGRVGQEVLTITVGSHRDLEHLLVGYNQAYNARRQRVLHGRSPEHVVRRRLQANPDLANPRYQPPDRAVMSNAMRAVAAAKDLSQPDNSRHLEPQDDRTPWPSEGRSAGRRT
jgi:transposase InsO family protein